MASTTNMILSFAELEVPGALAGVNILATASLVLLITSVVVILFAFLISRGLGCCRRLGCKGALFQDAPAPPPSASRTLPLPGPRHSAQIEMQVVRENPVAADAAAVARAHMSPLAEGATAPSLTNVHLGLSEILPVFALAPAAAAGGARDPWVDTDSGNLNILASKRTAIATFSGMAQTVRKSLSMEGLRRVHAREREQSSELGSATAASRNTALRGRLPAGWEALRDSDGRSYFHELSSGETTYTHPSVALTRKEAHRLALPPGWKAHVDQKTGAVYYANALSNKTSWEAPPVDVGEQVRLALLDSTLRNVTAPVN